MLRRLAVVRLFFFLFIFLLIFRLYQLQISAHDLYSDLASGQHKLLAELMPERGEIFVSDPLSRDNYPIASNITLSLVYAVPREVLDAKYAATILAPVLELEEAKLVEILSKTDDPYEPLKHAVSDELVGQIKTLQIKGIYTAPETVRYYFGGDDYGQLVGFIGFAGDSRKGQYGLEQAWDKVLAGERGELKMERAPGGGVIALGDRQIKSAVDGADIYLTIDKNIQARACAAIRRAVELHGAVSGSVVVMEPSTGAIKAMCGAPNFDPNKYADVTDQRIYSNQVVSDAYEPGSVFKAITMAAALEAGAVTPETTYLDTGEIKIGPHTIRNSDLKAHGVQTMTQVLQESLNTGAIFAMRQAGVEAFRHIVDKFGFGKLTNIELPNERAGNIAALQEKNEIFAATASFGQGISVTPLQLTAAFGAIANGGRLMKPYIIRELHYADGRKQVTNPVTLGQVISRETATTLAAMLVQVVEQGHGKRAGVPGYYIAGKTGTAQVPYQDKAGYDPSKTIGTFVGFGPVEAPKFVMTVRVNEPKDVVFAESSAAPVFGELAKFLLEYYQVPPQRSP
jgi:cell division protein FtsI (penicillin-binding protein 3)/stage V sporulation protein D (sporulation-specific penicillin-binding protein)